MDYIAEGLGGAVKLIFSFDPELWEIVALSLIVSGTATILAAIINIPIFTYIGLSSFRGQRVFARFLNTMMSIPSILVGLLVSLLLARRGIFGPWHLLYTPTAMIIAQTILISPLVAGLTYEYCRNRGAKIKSLGKTLGASKRQTTFLTIKELRAEFFVCIVASFSRAISEVGSVMLVGGNIKGQTRVITTTIAMLNSMGDYAMAIALGLILLMIALVVNSVMYSFKDPRLYR